MERLEQLKILLEKCLKQVEELQTSSNKIEEKEEENLSDAELAKCILKTLKKSDNTGTVKYVWIQKKYLDFRGNPDRKTGEPIKKYYLIKDEVTVSICDENQKVIDTYETKIWKLNKFRKELNKRGLCKKDEEWFPYIVTLKID